MKRKNISTVPKSADSSPKEKGGGGGDDDGHDGSSGGIRLARTIGFATGVNVLVGSMVGSGIFVSPGGVLRFVGGDPSWALLVWAGCGLLSLLGALCYAELGAAVPTAGGEYAYVRRAFGAPLAFLFAWTSVVLLRPAMNSAVALTFAEYALRPLFHGCPAPPAVVKCLAIASLLVVGILNCVSVKWAMRALDVLTLLKMLALAIVSVGGLVLLASEHTHNPLGSFDGPLPSPAQIGESFYQGLWAYGGWNALNYVTEELKDVHKNIIRCILVSVPLVTAFYVLVNISYLTVLTPREIISSAAVAVTWGDRVLGSFSWIVPLSVAVSTFGSLNCSAFVMGRLNYAAAREGHSLPLLAMLSVRHQTPTPAVAFSTLLSVAFVLPTDLIMLTNYFGFVTWLLVGLNCAGLLVLRYREPDLRRPYRVLWPVPVVVVLVCGYLVLAPIVSSPRYEYLFALLFVLAGFVFYVPFVHFKLRVPCLPTLTCWLQLLLEVSPTVAPATCVDDVR
ncbi:unnamed protein product [Lampetra planeri]